MGSSDFSAPKAAQVRQQIKLLALIYEGAVTGPKPPPTRRIREMFGTYKSEIYSLYRSHTQSRVVTAGEESKADTRGNLLKGWRFRLAVGALCLTPFLLSGAACSIFKFKEKVTGAGDGRGERSESPAVPAQPQPSAPPLKPQPKESSLWRFAGQLVIDGQAWFLIDGSRGTKLLPPELCKRDPVGDWVCTLGDQIITRFTGPPPEMASTPASVLPHL
ncbi:MAG: hypothetical protein QM661_08670 [Solimonas sp.]